MSCSADYAPRLRSLGYRVTSQRLAILHVLVESGLHLSPAQIFRRARSGARGLTQPTVYRTLEFLARHGIVQPSLNAHKHLVYQVSKHEHHHIMCSRCGSSLEIDHHSLRYLYQDIRRRSGYRLTESHLTLFGLCPRCQAKET